MTLSTLEDNSYKKRKGNGGNQSSNTSKQVRFNNNNRNSCGGHGNRGRGSCGGFSGGRSCGGRTSSHPHNQMVFVLFTALIHGKCVISTLTATTTILPQVAGLPILDVGEDTVVRAEQTTIIQMAKIKTFTMTIMVAGIHAKIHNSIHKVAAAGLPEAGLSEAGLPIITT